MFQLRFNQLFTSFFIGFLFFSTCCLAQTTTSVSGRVIDAQSGDPVPFANVYFKGATVGTTTDFEGYYTLTTTKGNDSLFASFVGYLVRPKYVQVGQNQTINFQLEPQVEEVVIYFRKGRRRAENPAWNVLRRVQDFKSENDKRRLNAYESENYTKLELDVDNISDKFKSRKMMQKIVSVVDSIEQVAGDDGKPVLPVFISETISKYYFRNSPDKVREDIIKTKISGIGVQDGSTLSQIIGSTFLDYNFYRDWISIVSKEFMSPIAEGWRLMYDYELESDNEIVDGIKCYKISFTPKRPKDLAFTGIMWITDSTHRYALKRIDATITKEANLNFIERIKVQQELVLVKNNDLSVWMPAKTRVLVDVAEIQEKWAGMLAKSYTSCKNYVVNQPRELKFYRNPLVVDEASNMSDDTYWEENRHDSLTSTEKNLFRMVDTIKQLPMVKSYIDLANFLIEGYQPLGPVEIGTYSYLYANNNVEGHRLRLKMKTNSKLSKHFTMNIFGAYGTEDEVFKYGGGFRAILKRRPWTVVSANYKYDINQAALMNESFRNTQNTLFIAATYWGDIVTRRPFMHREASAFFQTDLVKGFRQRITFRNQQIDPLFDFAYIAQNKDDGTLYNWINSTEIQFESRISFKERWIQNDLERYSAGSGARPVITLGYVMGIPDLLGSQLKFSKFYLGLDQTFRLGALGRSEYNLNAGYTPDALPYPLLENHLGNQNVFYNQLAFNLMNYFEFTSDRYVSLRFAHNFEGLIFNSIPLLKRAKLRTVAEGNILVGAASDRQLSIIPSLTPAGDPYPTFGRLELHRPYAEVAYGVENILKFIKVLVVHRLTYLDNPNVNKIGVRVSAAFRL
ncbi:MAG: carboxypeptidase-like regulatory domain-containing protein [Cytophagales bacterium]|nr:MAG: carboxypeptidase-like regulatory domain-containing protein [Cytophagales bacterium]